MPRKLLMILLCAGALAAAEKKVIFPPGTKVIGPYSPGILVGDYLYVSGQGARDAAGKFPETVELQVRQCLENMKTIVEAAGLTMDHVVYTQLYNPNPDPKSWAEVDRAWAKYFPKNGPARGVLGVVKLPDDTPMEINAVAIRNLADKKVIDGPGKAADGTIPAAVMAGGRLYISGMFGVAQDGSVPADGAEQTKLALDRMGEVLRAAGLDYRHVVFTNPYMTDRLGYEPMNRVYAKYFEFGNTPARATIHASALPYGTAIEYTAIAVKDLSTRRAVRPKNMPPSPTASPCVFAGDTFYCSAKSAFIPGPNSGIYASTVEEQVRMSLRNLLDGLEEGGLTFADVVASNVYLDDMADFSKMNRIYTLFFKSGAPPARTTVQQVAAVAERKQNDRDIWPELEQISIIAVK